MLIKIKNIFKPIYHIIDGFLRKHNNWYKTKRKYQNELNHWTKEFQHIKEWFVYDRKTWWGINPVYANQKERLSKPWCTNAVKTMHKIKPYYLEHLQITPETLKGKVLDFGCGPVSGILEFPYCEKYGVDPLINRYMELGWPLYDYGVTFINSKGESMPFIDGYFDAIISVNALDHVDNFNAVAKEILRCLKIGGKVYFEIEYHKATKCEPQELKDDIVVTAFNKCKMIKLLERTKSQVYKDVLNRFNLISNDYDTKNHLEKLVVWHGEKI